MIKPILVLAYGNPSRGDDALGPMAQDFIEQHLDLSGIELLTDFQLQIEHALDIKGRELVLFIDASVAGNGPFAFSELKPERDQSYTSHAMSPAAVLQVYESTIGLLPPPAFLLTILGCAFELGGDLSVSAQQNLALACRFIQRLLVNPDIASWRNMAGDP